MPTLSNPFQAAYRHARDNWLFQLREAETGEVYLSQRRVFILPTQAGMSFGVLLLLLFIGAINYNLSLGLGLTFLLAACAVIDMHFTFRNLAFLHLSAGRGAPVFAGEEARFELHLANRRRHDRYAIWVGFLADAADGIEQPVDLPAQGSTSVVLGLPATQRGWLRIPRVRLQTRFPLGLLRAWSYWRPDARVLVYPRPESDPPALPVAEASDGDGQGRAGADDFAGVRAYQAGDSLKRLAWRQIARLSSADVSLLVTKEFEGGAATELTLDFAQLPPALDLESKLSRITAWVIDAEARGMPYALRLGALSIDTGLGPSHRDQCLQAVALYGLPEERQGNPV